MSTQGTRTCPHLLTVPATMNTTPASQTTTSAPPMDFIPGLWVWTKYYVALFRCAKPHAHASSSILTMAPFRFLFFLHCLPTFYHSVTTLRYWIQVACLAPWACITSRSFLIRRPGYPPCFIAHPGSQEVKSFALTQEDREQVHRASTVHPDMFQRREWRPRWEVDNILTIHDLTYRAGVGLDLMTYHLTGPRLTQGRGIRGHNVNAILLEELGRWPDDRRAVAGRFFCWKTRRTVYGKIPVDFVAAAGIHETLDYGSVRVNMEWQDPEVGIPLGIQGYIQVGSDDDLSNRYPMDAPCIPFK